MLEEITVQWGQEQQALSIPAPIDVVQPNTVDDREAFLVASVASVGCTASQGDACDERD